MFVWQKGKKILINDKNQPDETNPITILDLEDNKSELLLDGQSVTGGGGSTAGVTSIEGQTGAVTLEALGIKELAKKDKVTDAEIDNEAISTSKIKDLDNKFTTLDEKLKNVKGVIRFKQSEVSSALAQSTELYKTDLANETDEPQVGNLAIFPDSKSLVLYIATITEVNGDSYTISDPEYLKDTWVMSGEWAAGPASYPEVYTYQGSTYLCLVSDTNVAPSKDATKEWRVIAEKPATPSYNDLSDKPEIPRPTFFKVTGDAMKDTGGIGQTYLVSNDNISPADWTLKTDDVIIFYTDLAYYIGKVTQTNGNGATVQVEQRLGYVFPDITEGDDGKILKVQDGKLALVEA